MVPVLRVRCLVSRSDLARQIANDSAIITQPIDSENKLDETTNATYRTANRTAKVSQLSKAKRAADGAIYSEKVVSSINKLLDVFGSIFGL